MSLKIYADAAPDTAFSTDGDFTNPLAMAFDGLVGGTFYKKFYVRNDDANAYYESITLEPQYVSGDNIIDGTDGYLWKLFAGDTLPLEEQWEGVGAGNKIDIPNIGTSSAGDIGTYEPFWIRVTIPRSAPVKSHTGIQLVITAEENLVS